MVSVWDLFNIVIEAFNMFTPVFMGLGAALGILIGMYLSRPKKNQVFKILPQDNRGIDFDVIQETSNFLYGEPFAGFPPQRFMKLRKGITVLKKRRLGRTFKMTRHLARDGTAYTQRLEKGKVENIPLDKTLKVMFGDEYNKMPGHLQELLEKSQIGVTIALEEDPLTPKDLPTIGEENIKVEEDRKAAETLWKAAASVIRQQAVQIIAWVGFGSAITFGICLAMGWIQLAPT